MDKETQERFMEEMEALSDTPADRLKLVDLLGIYGVGDAGRLPVLIHNGADKYPEQWGEQGFVLVKLRSLPNGRLDHEKRIQVGELRYGKFRVSLRKGDWTLMRLPVAVLPALMKAGALGPVASFNDKEETW